MAATCVPAGRSRLTLTLTVAVLAMMAMASSGCDGDDAPRVDNPVADPVRPVADLPPDPKAAAPQQMAGPMAEGQREGDNVRFALAYPTGDRASSALLLEKSGPAQVRLGQPYQYTIKVTNLTDKTLGGVTIVESMGDGFEFESSKPESAASQAGVNRWSLGELHPKQSQTIQATAVATKVGKLAACLAASYEPTLCTQIDVVQPQLKVTKVQAGLTEIRAEADAANQIAYLCDEVTYKYTVTNTGNGVAKNVTIADELPKGLQTADGKQAVAAQVGDLPAGQSKDIEVKIRPQQTGEFTSRAMAKSESDQAYSNSVTTPVREPELAVEVNGPEWQYVNQPVTYTVRVRNDGRVPARDVVLTLQAPGLSEEESIRQIGNLPAGQEKRVNLTLRPVEGGDIKVMASAKSRCATGEQVAANTTIKTIPALVLEMVDNKDPVQVGETTVYSIAVKNQGSGAAKNVSLTATLPPEFEFVEGAGQTAIKQDGDKLNFAPIAQLAPGEVATWWVEAKPTKAADARFRIELNSDYLKSPVPELEPTRAIEVQAAAK